MVLDVADDGAFEDPAERRGIADGERGAAVVVDELAHVHARTFADGELGAATAVVLVIKLGRDCN